jgi:c-di-GMP-binding flagellar brake protein YcgR
MPSATAGDFDRSMRTRLVVSEDSPVAEAHTRIFPRVGDSLLVSYTISEDIRPEYTEAYDIGSGGLAMLTIAELPLHHDVTIELELRGDARPKLRLTGQVRWSHHDVLLGKFRTGIAFLEQTKETERELLRYIDTIHRLRDLGFL